MLAVSPASAAAPKKAATVQYTKGLDFHFKGDHKRAIGQLKKAAAQRPKVYPRKTGQIILCEPVSRCTDMPPPEPPSASENAAEASCLLGDYYALGLGTRKNMSAAAKWWYLPVKEHDKLLAAAEKGDSVAQTALGDLYMTCPCVSHIKSDDHATIANYGGLTIGIAKEWFEAAAKSGNGEAAIKLGKLLNMQRYPEATTPDQAIGWFKMAAEQGIAEGQHEYGLRLRRNGYRREGLEWLRKAEAQGYAPAIKYLQEGRTKELYSDGRYEGFVSLFVLVAGAFGVFMIRKKKPLRAYMTWRVLAKSALTVAIFVLAFYAIKETPFLSQLFDRMFTLLMKSRAYMPDALADNMYLFTALLLIMLIAFVASLVILFTALAQIVEQLLSAGTGNPKP